MKSWVYSIFILLLLLNGCAATEPSAPSEWSYQIEGSTPTYSNSPAPRDADTLSETEQYFLAFAKSYSIACINLDFSSPEDLSDEEKYRIFVFLQNHISREKGDAYALEKQLYSTEDEACVVPVALVNQWLEEYLNTAIAEPESALPAYDSERFGYDARRDAFVVPSLSGFGGVRACGLLESSQEGELLTMTIGFYHPDYFDKTPPVYFLSSTVRMQIKLDEKERLKYQMLCWETTEF